MKRFVLLVTVLLAFAFSAVAQDTSATGSASGQTATKSSKSSKKKSSDAASADQAAGGAATSSNSGKSSTLTGCVSSSAGSDGNYTLSNGRYKNGVSLTPTDKVKDHAGHQVSLKGSWSGDKKSFNVDSVKHISETCSTAPGGGTTGSKSSGTKGGKKGSKAGSDSTSTPKGF